MSLGYLAGVYVLTGEGLKANELFERALYIHRKVSNRVWEGRTLMNFGMTHLLLGDAHRAARLCEQALEIQREAGDRVWEVKTLGFLSSAYAASGQTQKSIESRTQELRLHQEAGNRVSEGRSLGSLGVTIFNAGDRRGVQLIEQALEISRQVEDKMFEAVWSNTLEQVKGHTGGT